MRTPILGYLTAASLVIAIYSLYFCLEKTLLASSQRVKVGDDIVVIAYLATISTCIVSGATMWLARRDQRLLIAFTRLTFGVCCAAFCFWTILHLSGTVVSYSHFLEERYDSRSRTSSGVNLRSSRAPSCDTILAAACEARCPDCFHDRPFVMP